MYFKILIGLLQKLYIINIKNDKAATLKSADNMADAKLEFASEKN